MRKISFILFSCSVLLAFAVQAMADQCAGALPVGTATGCGVLISVTAVNGAGDATAFTVANLGNGNPYDGAEDTLVGIQNNSGGVLNDIALSGTSGLFGFDGDGPCTFNAADCFGPTGYEGPNNTFTVTDANHGTVVFTTGITLSGSTWFALEGTPQSITGTPEPSTLLLLGSGLLGFACRRWKA
jgi:hypothetical protein